MRIGLRVGTSLLALLVAVPTIPATITVAQAQGLLDTLFRKPAQRKRAKRAQQRQVRQRRATRTVRRQRAQQRQTAKRRTVRQAAPKKVAKKRTSKKKAVARRAAPIQQIRNVGFKNYTPEAMETVDIASTANVVAAAFASERVLLETNPMIRQLPPQVDEARAPAQVLDNALSARAFMPVPTQEEANDPRNDYGRAGPRLA